MPCREINQARGKESSFKLKNKEVPINRHKENGQNTFAYNNAPPSESTHVNSSRLPHRQGRKSQNHQGRKKYTHRERAITRIERTYGFKPMPSITAFSNAIHLHLNSPLPTVTTPLHSQSLAFHDLTPGRVIPDGMKTILGLSAKVIHTCKFTKDDITTSLSWFDQDMRT